MENIDTKILSEETLLIMENIDTKILSEGIIDEVGDFIEKAKKIKKILKTFIDNADLLSDESTDEEVALVFKNIDIKISDVNSVLSSLLSDSKKLNSFLHEIKLLKRKRVERLNRDKKNDLDTWLKEMNKNKNKNTPYSPIYPPSPYSPIYPNLF